jgi:glutathionylspermidine synthase
VAWKLILSNKAILPILWQLAPDCEYLLSSSYDDNSELAEKLRRKGHVRKPIFGREGGSVSLVYAESGEILSNPGEYGAEGFVLQQLQKLPVFNGYHFILGSWIIDGEPGGMGVRADSSAITTNRALFVPHFIEPTAEILS